MQFQTVVRRRVATLTASACTIRAGVLWPVTTTASPGARVLRPGRRALGGTFRTEPHDVVANDEHAVALFTARAGRADWRLEDRRAAEVWIYPADLYASDEFWS
jgi:hypothetical protein